MAIKLPKTHLSLLEAFNLVGEKQCGAAWTGDEARLETLSVERCELSGTDTLEDMVERYCTAWETLNGIMADGVSAEQLLRSGWAPLRAHEWELPPQFSLKYNGRTVGNLGDKVRKIRIDKAAFDSVLQGSGSEARVSSHPSPNSYSEAKLRRWYRKRVAGHDEAYISPSVHDDLKAARMQFPGVPRDVVRAVRRHLAPNGWKNPGRRKTGED